MNSNPARDEALAALDIPKLVKPCPCCREPIKHADEIWFNGDGPPPVDAVCCGSCGCMGGHGRGKERGDYKGSILDAIRVWNEMPRWETTSYGPKSFTFRGRIERAGSDENGQPRVLIHTTKAELAEMSLAYIFDEVTVRLWLEKK